MVAWIQTNWDVSLVILIVGIFIGWLFRFIMRAIDGLNLIVNSTDRIKMEGDIISRIYKECYPKSTKMQDQVEKLGGELWKVQTFNDHVYKLEAFGREIEKLQREILKIKENR